MGKYQFVFGQHGVSLLSLLPSSPMAFLIISDFSPSSSSLVLQVMCTGVDSGFSKASLSSSEASSSVPDILFRRFLAVESLLNKSFLDICPPWRKSYIYQTLHLFVYFRNQRAWLFKPTATSGKGYPEYFDPPAKRRQFCPRLSSNWGLTCRTPCSYGEKDGLLSCNTVLDYLIPSFYQTRKQ